LSFELFILKFHWHCYIFGESLREREKKKKERKKEKKKKNTSFFSFHRRLCVCVSPISIAVLLSVLGFRNKGKPGTTLAESYLTATLSRIRTPAGDPHELVHAPPSHAG